MRIIETHIEKYIDTRVDKAIEKAVSAAGKEFEKTSKRHMEAVLERFDESLKVFKELVPAIPTEDRIREIVREEIKPLDTKLGICIAELQDHDKRISKLEWDFL